MDHPPARRGVAERYTFCRDCHFNNREPAICDVCDNGSEFESNAALDEEGYRDMKRIRINRKEQ
jgi:hypothetical protein